MYLVELPPNPAIACLILTVHKSISKTLSARTDVYASAVMSLSSTSENEVPEFLAVTTDVMNASIPVIVLATPDEPDALVELRMAYSIFILSCLSASAFWKAYALRQLKMKM